MGAMTEEYEDDLRWQKKIDDLKEQLRLSSNRLAVLKIMIERESWTVNTIALNDREIDAIIDAALELPNEREAVPATESLPTPKTIWPAEKCSYPRCTCPLDHPGTPGWCARGLPTGDQK